MANSSSSTSPADLLEGLSRLAAIDADADRLRRRRPVGWGSRVAVNAAEAKRIRRDLGLKYERDEVGDVFLTWNGIALQFVPPSF